MVEDQGNLIKTGATITVKQFTSINDLNNLFIIAQDRKQWEGLINVICFAKEEWDIILINRKSKGEERCMHIIIKHGSKNNMRQNKKKQKVLLGNTESVVFTKCLHRSEALFGNVLYNSVLLSNDFYRYHSKGTEKNVYLWHIATRNH